MRWQIATVVPGLVFSDIVGSRVHSASCSECNRIPGKERQPGRTLVAQTIRFMHVRSYPNLLGDCLCISSCLNCGFFTRE